MYKVEDCLVIIRDVEELERLGFQFIINDEKLVINGTVDEDEGLDISLLNSYIGLIEGKEYYNDDTIYTAIKYKEELKQSKNEYDTIIEKTLDGEISIINIEK